MNISSLVKEDEIHLTNYLESTYKSNIMKSLSDPYLYEYSKCDKLKQIYDKIILKYNNEINKHVVNISNTKFIDEFNKFNDGEQIILFKLFSITKKKNDNNCVQSDITDKYLLDTEFYDYKNNMMCRCNQYYIRNTGDLCNSLCGGAERISCSEYSFSGSKINHGFNTNMLEKVSIRFLFLTNYGRLICNFSNTDTYTYFASSYILYKHYNFMLPIDYINIIQHISESNNIFKIMDVITTELYCRTTFDKPLIDIEIEIIKIKNQIDQLLEKTIKYHLYNNKSIKESNVTMLKEYYDLLKIKEKYNGLISTLETNNDTDCNGSINNNTITIEKIINMIQLYIDKKK